jgi:cytochrome P450 / NADPH-cytochrome P450 reductase
MSSTLLLSLIILLGLVAPLLLFSFRKKMDDIPGPRGLPFLGNTLDIILDEVPLHALEHLADIYGPIYQFTIKGRRRIVCSSTALMAELTDEKRFVKMPPIALSQGKGAKGLFVADTDDPDWGQSHRILIPAFGPLPTESMFDGMLRALPPRINCFPPLPTK